MHKITATLSVVKTYFHFERINEKSDNYPLTFDTTEQHTLYRYITIKIHANTTKKRKNLFYFGLMNTISLI